MPTWSRPRHARRRRPRVLAGLLLTAALSAATLSLGAPAAQAAVITVDQCNNVGPGPAGATTGMTCTVSVVNTITSGVTSSTTTVTRLCSLDPCPSGNGTFTSSSTSLVTSINQCNGSDNDAAHPITCNVSIVNNISADTPGAQPISAATVNQCVGSATGGGGVVSCDPVPASTTGATVTQCNGSGNGGGGTVDCVVASTSTVSPAIDVHVNQCNATGNPGGSVVTCRTAITTNITAVVVVSPTPTRTPTQSASPVVTPAGSSDQPTAGPSQVTRVPTGGVSAGGGSTSGLQHRSLLGLGGLFLLGATLAAGRRRTVVDPPRHG